MDGYFIQQIEPNVFGIPCWRQDLLDYSKEELASDNWYPLVIARGLQYDINQKQITTYELRDDGVVYQTHTLVNKEGDELNQAIRNKWMQVRLERSELFSKNDWTQLPDAPITNEQRAAWATYRQALRDITNQTDPFNITWPTDPNGRTNAIGVTRV